MAGLQINEGTGATLAFDKVGTASAPTTDDRLQYVKLDAGAAGTSVPVENGSAANLAATTSSKGLLAVRPGDWSVTHAPAADTQATITKAAGGASVRHVCTGFIVTLAGGAAAPTAALVTVNLRDGATGAGTILSTMTLGLEAVAGKSVVYAVTGLNVVGSANTAMTVETSASPGANASASVTLMGYTV